MTWTPELIALVGVTFLVAGMVKGVVGLGMPTVSLAILAATVDLKQGIVLILVPSLVSNLWQSATGGALGHILRRFWSLLLTTAIGVWIGASWLAKADTVLLTGILGALLMVYSLISLTTPRLPPPGRNEVWLSPVFGALGGIAAGLTGSFVVPGTLYIQAIGLPRDVMVQALGVTFTVCTAMLAIALAGHGMLPRETGLLSVAALVPAMAGMVIGQRIRKTLSEARFRQVFFGALLLLGAYLAARAFV